MSEQAKRLTQAIREAVEAHIHTMTGDAQWYVSEFVIDCDADEFWQVTEQALDRALKG